jgi:hypothetical protein
MAVLKVPYICCDIFFLEKTESEELRIRCVVSIVSIQGSESVAKLLYF